MAEADVQLVVLSLEEFTARQVVELMLGINAGLTEDTPVDTGWARSNWVSSIGEPIETTVGSRGEVSGQAQQSGAAALAGYKSTEEGPIWVCNNVPYIQPLNDGHSKQAPAGFVQNRIALELLRMGK